MNEMIAIGAGLFVVWLLTYMGTAMTTEAECYRLGYMHSAVTVSFDRYCGTRVDQTDVVLTLTEARRYPRTGAK